MKLILILSMALSAAAVLSADSMTATTVVDAVTFDDALKSIGETCYCMADSVEFDAVLASVFLDIHDPLTSFSVEPSPYGFELIGVWDPSWTAPVIAESVVLPIVNLSTSSSFVEAADPDPQQDPAPVVSQGDPQVQTVPEPGTFIAAFGIVLISLARRFTARLNPECRPMAMEFARQRPDSR